MTKDWPQLAKDLSQALKEVRAGVPDVMAGFSAMAKAATATNALDTKTKELIALAIGIAVRCDGCIAFHAKELVKLGASRQEVLEVAGMAVYMGGGPSFMTAAEAIEAYDQFVAAAQK